MKKLLLAAAFVAASIAANAAALNVTFNGTDNEGWSFGQNAQVTYTDGHAVVEMSVQSTGEDGQPNKWRADVIYNAPESAGYTFNPASDKIVAIKFIGDRPQGNLTFEVQNPDENVFYSRKNSPNGTVTTVGGNTIIYYDLTAMGEYASAAPFTTKFLQVKIADNTAAPHAYTLDWIKVYDSVEALEADKNVKDDGSNDADEANVAKLAISNETTGAQFNSLEEAFNAAAEGDVLVINQNIEVGKRLAVPTKLTIRGASQDVTIKRTAKAIMLLVNAETTFENITLSSIADELDFVYLEVNKVNLFCNDVIFSGISSKKDQGIVALKQGGKFNSNNVTFVNCSSSNGSCPGYVFLGSNGQVNLDGVNENVSVTIEKSNAAVTVRENFSINGDPVGISYKKPEEVALGSVVVNGTRNPALFTFVGYSDRYIVANPDESSNSLVVTDSSAVEAVAAEAAPAEYFDLTGRRVEAPANGLYIVRQGNSVRKIVL